MTRGAKCFLDIRWLPLRSILHSRPNLPNTITSISPEDPRLYLPPFMVAKQPWVEGATHEVKWFWGITIVTSEFCTTPIQESRQKNGPDLGKKKSPQKTSYDGRESKRRYKLWHKGGAAVGFLIRIIQGEMAPGLGEISTAFSRISPGTIWTQSCLMSPTHPSCM